MCIRDSVTPAEALATVARPFGTIPASPEPIPGVYTTEPEQQGERRFVVRRAGADGVMGFLGVVAGSFVLTAVFLAIAAALTAGATSTRRAHHLAAALVIWFVAIVLFDVAALGVASLLRSGTASRLLMVAVIVNPVDAVRTGTLLSVEGTTAFGAASLAFLRMTGGALGAGLYLAASVVAWVLLPVAAAGSALLVHLAESRLVAPGSVIGKALHPLEQLEGKANKAIKQQHAVELARLHKILFTARPGGKPMAIAKGSDRKHAGTIK